jgi:hypothetical protein
MAADQSDAILRFYGGSEVIDRIREDINKDYDRDFDNCRVIETGFSHLSQSLIGNMARLGHDRQCEAQGSRDRSEWWKPTRLRLHSLSCASVRWT